MSTGKIVSIHIAPSRGAPTQECDQVQAIAGEGLSGDRFWGLEKSENRSSGRQITLIEIEAIEALQREQGINLSPGASRRNLVTRGVALNHLVERTFQVGKVRMRGVRLCEPCNHLESLTKPDVRQGLIHRGGLRAEILNDGIIKVGDQIQLVSDE